MFIKLVLFQLLLIFTQLIYAGNVNTYSMIPGQSIENIYASYDQDIIFYMELKPNCHYNVHISYPGSVPATFQTYIEELVDGSTLLTKDRSHQLLDTKIMSFSTNIDGFPYAHIQLNNELYEEIIYNNVLHVIPHILSPSKGNQVLVEDRVFSIILQETYMHVTPILWHQIFIIVFTFITTSFLMYYAYKYLYIFIKYF